MRSQAKDLAEAIAVIKQSEPKVRQVGVWITINGYWNGLDARAFLSTQSYALKCPSTFWASQHLPCLEALEPFWLGYLNSLKRAGVGFVKVDNQAMLDWITPQEAQDVVFKQCAFSVMQTVALNVFGPTNVIHCVCHLPIL